MNVLMREKIKSFLIEDIGTGDLSSELLFSKTDTSEGTFLAKDDGIVSGMDIPQMVYELLGGEVSITAFKKDGDVVKKGEFLLKVEGDIQTLLKGERLILNLMQRMSGIATMTHTAVEVLGDDTIQICDTRKTAPGLRVFDKYAVTCGGGVNHRFGLYDGVMLKDNHIAYAGSIAQAVAVVRKKLGHMTKIEVEIETKEQLLEAIEAKADIIMLDNQLPETIQEWQKLVPASIVTEASGGITLANLADYKHCGVNMISLGFLTNSVQNLDISFNKEKGGTI